MGLVWKNVRRSSLGLVGNGDVGTAVEADVGVVTDVGVVVEVAVLAGAAVVVVAAAAAAAAVDNWIVLLPLLPQRLFL